ncbi:MAG: hypothetical protein GDA50_07050 [Alphaproteobacteria bacterium GM202ARS2]|nr:hypothetical protein [Alphaproteobacteria bacterium GM202ARS2]
MIVVIQCAGSKRDKGLWREDGRDVYFVSRPNVYRGGGGYVVKNPGDSVGSGEESYRQALWDYNRHYQQSGENPYGLFAAWQLYSPNIYSRLFQRYGRNVYILSAGWGLLRADFLTPNYDITFSPQAEGYKRRAETDDYRGDLCCLPPDTTETCVCFVGKSYLRQLDFLTRDVEGGKHLFYSTQVTPHMPGFIPTKYETTTRTNWHYGCAKDFMTGKIGMSNNHVHTSSQPSVFTYSFRESPRAGGKAPGAQDFRDALERKFVEAEQEGKTCIKIKSGDLHREVGGYPGSNHRMPICCKVMCDSMQEGDKVVYTPPKGRGATLTICYKLPR